LSSELKKIWQVGGISTSMSSRWIIIYIFFIADSICCRAPERIMLRAKFSTTTAFELF